MSDLIIVQVFKGNIIHSTEEKLVEIIENGLLGVTKQGKIAFMEPGDKWSVVKTTFKFNAKVIVQLSKNQFLMPGLIDALVLASPPTITGNGNNLTTMDWLRIHVFPMELKFEDLDYSVLHLTRVMQTSLRCGTTTGVYHCPIYPHASLALLELAEKYGQSAFIGKSCVVSNAFCPEYTELYDTSVNHTVKLIRTIQSRQLNRVHPIVTPRSAPYCTLALMKELSDMAIKYNCPVQTSTSETLHENALVDDLFPGHSSYTDVYNQCGLLTRKTLLAHAIHLDENELELLYVKNVSVTHCPQSDLARGNGMMNARKYLKMGVNVCLGTDVGSGSSFSMFDVMKRAIEVSQGINCAVTTDGPRFHQKPLTYGDALKMATLNAAKALGIDKDVGNFLPGKYFDALLIDMDAKNSNVYQLDSEPFGVAVNKFFLSGNETNIKDVYVSGRLVYSNRSEFQFD